MQIPPAHSSAQVILLATDFCAPARSALVCARQIARQRGASVHALHVMDLTSASAAGRPSYTVVHDSAQSRLRDIRRELRLAGLPESATLVTAGRPAQAIRRIAATDHASLLVLGVNGSRSRKASTLGATARALLGHAPCPILTVQALDIRSHPSCDATQPLFVIDTAAESLHAALAAWPMLSGARHIRVVFPPDGKRSPEFDPETARRFAPARVLELPGAPFALLRDAAELRAGLIVLAFRAGGYLDSFATGSFAHAVVTEAPCPVLTVRC